MTTPLVLDTGRRDDGTFALLARGEIDMSNVATFSQAIHDAITASSADARGAGGGDGDALLVDLSAVDYIDSAGINVLFTNADRIRLIVKPLLLPVLTISGMTQLARVEAHPPVVDR